MNNAAFTINRAWVAAWLAEYSTMENCPDKPVWKLQEENMLATPMKRAVLFLLQCLDLPDAEGVA